MKLGLIFLCASLRATSIPDKRKLSSNSKRRVRRQFFGGGGGGFGDNGVCSQFAKELRTVRYECYVPDAGEGTTACSARSSSIYIPPQGSTQSNPTGLKMNSAQFKSAYKPSPFTSFYKQFDASLAIDGQLAPFGENFFHSGLEANPWIRIQFLKPNQLGLKPKDRFSPIDLHGVDIWQRCDSLETHRSRITILFETLDDYYNNPVRMDPRNGLVGGSICHTGIIEPDDEENPYLRQLKRSYQCSGASRVIRQRDVISIWIQKSSLNSGPSNQKFLNPFANPWSSDYSQNARPGQNYLMINEIEVH